MSQNCAQSVEVALPLPVQTAYSYRVPEDMRGSIELGKRISALGPQSLRCIQDFRNALLLNEGREGNFD